MQRIELCISLTLFPTITHAAVDYEKCHVFSNPITPKQMLSKRVLCAKVQPNAASHAS
jgi:hypothetical protein